MTPPPTTLERNTVRHTCGYVHRDGYRTREEFRETFAVDPATMPSLFRINHFGLVCLTERFREIDRRRTIESANNWHRLGLRNGAQLALTGK